LNANLEALDQEVWAILPSVARQIRAFLAGDTSVRAAISRTPAQPRTSGVVSVIPIHGMIERRSSLLAELFGGSSVETIRGQLRAALADPEVGAIVLNVDSPGGSVAGITELAQEIRAARDVKPIVAVADTTAASAAYWLASQATRVLVTPSGQVGSIGIYGVHMDVSRALDAQGVTATVISSGEKKVAESPYSPLTDEARAALQARSDAYYEQFVNDVAKGRGASAATVKSDYGEGSVLLAGDALKAGMVDAIGTTDDALRLSARLVRGLQAGSETVELGAEDPQPFTQRVAHLQADALSVVEHAKVRAELREKEGRPPLSDNVLASLRSTRDALSALLPDEPPAVPQADDPPPVVPPPAATTPRRVISDEEWLRSLTAARSH
jgi:signal peptide peptidase SppA